MTSDDGREGADEHHEDSSGGSSPTDPSPHSAVPNPPSGSGARGGLAPTSPHPGRRGRLEFCDLGFDRNGQPVLSGLSLLLEPGTSCVIAAEPADQTTLISLLHGLLAPTRGAIRLDERELRSLPLAETRTQIAVCLADPWLLDGSIAENIAFGRPSMTRARMVAAAAIVGLDAAIDQIDGGLDALVGPDGCNLSLTQRRMVALARAVAGNPSVLLLEDPTRDLDDDEVPGVMAAVQSAAASRTSLITTRRIDPRFVVDVCYRLTNGRLISPVPFASSDTGAFPWSGDGALHAPAVGRDPGHGSRRRAQSRPAWSVTVGQNLAPHYRAAGLLERSAHTETWLAWHHDRPGGVSIRLPRRRPITYTAFEELGREYEVARQLRHPGFPAALGADLSAARPYVVYERIEGRSLARLISEAGGPLELPQVLAIGYEITRLLDHLHRKGVVHLHLRPEVIVRSYRGCVITDLRSALPVGEQRIRFIDRHHRRFVAPELLRGAPAARAMDLHGLGAVLYQLVTGEMIDHHRDDELTIVDDDGELRPCPVHDLAPDADPGVVDLINRLMAPQSGVRPPAGQVLAELRPMLLRHTPDVGRAA
ncbi:MAG: protein kinase domain-containing protein [Acidimicrobiales bacterium]